MESLYCPGWTSTFAHGSEVFVRRLISAKEETHALSKVIPTGIAHGTVTIHIFGMQLETTTFRTEADYSDGRHPDKVEYARTIEEDLSRRDFTMNAIAADLADGKLIDPFDGQKDIEKLIEEKPDRKQIVGQLPKFIFDKPGLH